MRRSELARVRAMEAALGEQEERLGPDDPRTVESRVRLVEAYEQLPDYDDEQRSWEERSAAEMTRAVDSRTRTLGAGHPDTLTLRYKLAFLRLHLNDDRGALLAELREITDGRLRALGPAHPDTLQSWDMLARHCPDPERPGLRERVENGWVQVLADREQRLGPDHPETLGAVLELAKVSDGRRQQELRQRMIVGWERIAAERAGRLGLLHPATVEAREEHLTRVEVFAGAAEGRRLREKVVADHERALGPDHPATVRAQIQLLAHSGMPGGPSPEVTAAAEALIERALGILGPVDSSFLRLRYLLMATHLVAGHEEAARAVGHRYPSPDDDFFIWEGPAPTA
ncbi:tetratricopeptide repeat protein [Actinoplanes sp. NPDC051343]|uniref:tetratricopeptide repeat protein n=1 Tax=Actinoplanes sp. NPDC051343 TaxID=3363906 RepID=UPI0037AB9075